MYSFRKKNSIKSLNSSAFSVYRNNLSYTKDGKVFLEKDGVLVFEFDYDTLNSITLVDDMLLVFDEENNLKLFNTKNYLPIDLELEYEAKVLNFQNFEQLNWIILKELSLFENILGIVNLKTKVSFLTEDFYPEVIFNEFVFGGSYFKKIFRYNLKNGALLWQTDISQIGKYIPFLEEEERDGEVDQFVGVWSNELILLLKGGKFIGIDVETGNINWEQNRVQNNKTSHTIDFNFGEPYHPFLNEEKGMIYILQGEAFIELDLKTKIATYTWSSLELTSENYVFIRQSRLFDNKILFSAFRKGNIGNDDTIGIFDIEKKEIIWQYTFDFEKDNFIPNSQNSIQMNDNNVYVLDWKGTLHIFEKE